MAVWSFNDNATQKWSFLEVLVKQKAEISLVWQAPQITTQSFKNTKGKDDVISIKLSGDY